MSAATRLAAFRITDACTGEAIWLGAESDVWEAVRAEWGDDVTGIIADGWMADVGWDRDTYERKRDFEAETGYQGWWEGCSAAADGVETRRHRRAWRVRWASEVVA